MYHVSTLVYWARYKCVLGDQFYFTTHAGDLFSWLWLEYGNNGLWRGQLKLQRCSNLRTIMFLSIHSRSPLRVRMTALRVEDPIFTEASRMACARATRVARVCFTFTTYLPSYDVRGALASAR